MNILYIGRTIPEYIAIMKTLLAEGYHLSAIESASPELGGVVAKADFLLVLAPITREIIARARKVKLIQAVGAGYNNIDCTAAAEAGIPVATTGDSNATSVAEHIVALILTLYRRINYAHHAVKEGKWPQFEIWQGGSFELSGKVIGLIGLGNVGRALALTIDGFRVEKLYHDPRRPSLEEERALKVSYLALDDLVRQADIVSMQVPLTDQTRGLVGRRELGLMKENAILINTSRGPIVDEEALIEWLSEGRIAGAGLDVFCREPLDPTSAFLKLDNVVLTPHIAGASRESVRRTFEAAFKNVARVASGKEPLNMVEATLPPNIYDREGM